MPSAGHFGSETTHMMRIIWSCLGMSRTDLRACISELPEHSNILIRRKDVAWAMKNAPRHKIFIVKGHSIAQLTEDGKCVDTMSLHEHRLPSQLQDHPPHAAVALDIVVRETTLDAWDEIDRLAEAGRPPQAVASALVGTPDEIAQRLDDYYLLGIHDIILSCPVDQLPPRAICQTVFPLLERHPNPPATNTSALPR